jgi:hypothetical protein
MLGTFYININTVPWQETVNNQRLFAQSDRAVSKIRVHFTEGVKKWGGYNCTGFGYTSKKFCC